MAVKTITIDMEAYNILAKQKKKGESFSQVIKRRLRKQSTAKHLLENLKLYAPSDECLDKIDQVIKDRDKSLTESEIIG